MTTTEAEQAAAGWEPPTQNHDPRHFAFARECYAAGYAAGNAEADRLTRERDAITGLCYRRLETDETDRAACYRIAILSLCLQPEAYDTEDEVVAAVRKLAGLDAAEDRGHLLEDPLKQVLFASDYKPMDTKI